MRARPPTTFLALAWKWLVFAWVGFISSLQQNVGVGLLALGLSASLWLFVINEQNPPREGVFGDLISVHPVNVPTGLDLLNDIERVSVRISTPEDRWKSIAQDTFEATVDLSELGPGQHEEVVRVRSKDSRVLVKGVFPSKVTVELDPIKSVVVPVQINILEEPPKGYTVSKAEPSVRQVTVSGPTKLVELVDSAFANVNLKGLKSEFRQAVPLVPRTDRGYDVERVRVVPPSATVGVTIIREISFVELPVLPEIIGRPQSGFWVAATLVSPTTAAVVGPREILQNLSFVKTEPVNINNATSDVIRNVNLALPIEVYPVTPQPIRVQVQVVPADGVRPFQIVPSLVGLSPGRTADIDVDTVEVRLAGPVPVLSKVAAAQLSVTLDVSKLGPGTYTVEANIAVPSSLTVASLSPSKVTVTIR